MNFKKFTKLRKFSQNWKNLLEFGKKFTDWQNVHEFKKFDRLKIVCEFLKKFINLKRLMNLEINSRLKKYAYIYSILICHKLSVRSSHRGKTCYDEKEVVTYDW